MNRVTKTAGSRWMAVATSAAAAITFAAMQPANAALVFDVRATGVASGVATISDGGKTVNATPDAVINYSVFAQVTGSDAGLEGFQQASGTLASGTGNQLVNLTHALAAPFDGASSLAGTPTDLGGDGDTDIGGSLAPTNATTGRITYRSTAMTTGSATGVSEFLLGTGTMTVGAASPTGTSVNFIVATATLTNRVPSWQEDGAARNVDTGTFSVGAPVVVAVPEPAALGLLGLGAALGLLRRRSR